MIFGLPRRGHRLFGNVDFFLVNCLQLRSLLASERSGVVKTFRWQTHAQTNSHLLFALVVL